MAPLEHHGMIKLNQVFNFNYVFKFMDYFGVASIKTTVNQGLVTLAFAGVEVNLVLFSKSVLRHSNAEAAHTFSTWMGTVYLFSLMGAFLSDSYLGRYITCVIFQVVYIIVSFLIALSLHFVMT